MPVTAAGLADIGARDLQPLVLRGLGQHPLEQLTVAGLQFGLRLKLAPCVADPAGQRVANRLQLAQVEGARLGGDRSDTGVDLHSLESVGEKRAELGFQAPDLAPQLCPREPFVAIHAKRGTRLSFEQVRHSSTRV